MNLVESRDTRSMHNNQMYYYILAMDNQKLRFKI